MPTVSRTRSERRHLLKLVALREPEKRYVSPSLYPRWKTAAKASNTVFAAAGSILRRFSRAFLDDPSALHVHVANSTPPVSEMVSRCSTSSSGGGTGP